MAGFDGLVRAAPEYVRLLRSQYWAPAQFERYIAKHLAETLTAAARIPFYRERLPAVAAGRSELTKLPILPRFEVPELERSVRSLRGSQTLLTSSRTSGSSGMPVSFFYDSGHQASRYAARARYLRANGWNPLLRSAWIVSTGIRSPDATFGRHARWFGAKFWSHLIDLEQLAHAIKTYDPVFVYAYPVNLDGLTRIFEAEGWRLPSLRRIFSGSEVLEDSLRARLRKSFGVEVSDNYGSTEAFLAWECPEGSYHVNAEHVVLEIVDDAGRAVLPGMMGRVLVTTLRNLLMPLVRYEIGDYAVAADGPCRCGRSLPRIGGVVGRAINLFLDGSRKRISPWALFRPLTAREWIRQFQVVQRDIGSFVVRFVGDRPPTSSEEAEIRAHFEKTLQARATIEFQQLERIPRSPSGKFLLALNEMDA
jgi:phenylacetate-CoA ligase